MIISEPERRLNNDRSIRLPEQAKLEPELDTQTGQEVSLLE